VAALGYGTTGLTVGQRVFGLADWTRNGLDWPGTWTDRAGRDRTPSVPGHDLSGVVAESLRG
jgi:hypothetical protein